jgi:hypothetical protein
MREEMLLVLMNLEKSESLALDWTGMLEWS